MRRNHLDCEKIDKVKHRNKSQPVVIYQVLE